MSMMKRMKRRISPHLGPGYRPGHGCPGPGFQNGISSMLSQSNTFSFTGSAFFFSLIGGRFS